MSEFEALCANDGELAKLRTSIRDFLATDRAAFGWEPAVGSYRLVSRRDHHRLLDDRYTVDDVGLHSIDELTL